MTTQSQQVSIPADWDGESWDCYQITWPDSAEWRALLRGLVSLAAGGRMWKAESGTITEVQKTGRDIISYNIPLIDCAGDEVIDSGLSPEQQITYVYNESEDENMGWLCGVNPAAFRIVDGVLSVKNFCGEWVEIGDLTSPEDVSPNPFPFPEPITVPVSACGKASSILNAAFVVMEAAVEYGANETEFYTQVYNAYQSVGVKPGKADIFLLQIDIVALREVVSDGTILDPDLQSLMICKTAVGMKTDSAEAVSEEVDWVYSSVRSACYEFLIDTISSELLWTAYEQVIQAMGTNDRLSLISRGSQDFESTCDCPNLDADALPDWVDEGDWYMVFNFQGNQPLDTTLRVDNGISVITDLGLALQANTSGSDKTGFTWTPGTTGSTVNRVKIEMLAADAWIAESPWVGVGFSVGGIGGNKQSGIIGTNGIYVYENTAVSFAAEDFALTIESDVSGTYDPIHPIVARCIIQGTGPHPYGW